MRSRRHTRWCATLRAGYAWLTNVSQTLIGAMAQGPLRALWVAAQREGMTDRRADEKAHRNHPLGPSRRQRHLLPLKIDLSSPRWLPANGRPPPCPRLLPLPAMACLAAPPRHQGPRREGSVGREGLSSGRSPLSSVADGAGAPAHHSAEQPYRPLGGAVRRGAVALAGICRGVWRLASRSPEAPGGW